MKLTNKKTLVSENRSYLVKNVDDAKIIANSWLEDLLLNKATTFGLPEIDDRYHIWRVPLKDNNGSKKVGEIVIDAYLGIIDEKKTHAL